MNVHETCGNKFIPLVKLNYLGVIFISYKNICHHIFWSTGLVKWPTNDRNFDKITIIIHRYYIITGCFMSTIVVRAASTSDLLVMNYNVFILAWEMQTLWNDNSRGVKMKGYLLSLIFVLVIYEFGVLLIWPEFCDYLWK